MGAAIGLLLVAIFWLGLSIAVGAAASNKGRDPAGWFFLALLISPLLAIIFLLVSPDLRTVAAAKEAARENAEAKTCPRCAEKVKRAAKVCRFCGNEFEVSPPIVRRAPSSSPIDPFELARRDVTELRERLSRLSTDELVRIAFVCGMDEHGYAARWKRDDVIRYIVDQAVSCVRSEASS